MHQRSVLVPVVLAAFAIGGGVFACSTTVSEDTLGTQAAAAKGDPPGNNGTVKIQEVDANDEIPDNDPHVGCKFKIEFRGFDEGDLHATWKLDAHAPTGSGTLLNGSVFIGEDAAGGANDLDATVIVDLATADLSKLTPHPIQGYHIKLEVHAEGSIGADTKFKVFWAKCAGSSSSSSGGSSSGGSSSGGSSSGGSSSGGSSSGGSSSGGSSSGGSSGKTW